MPNLRNTAYVNIKVDTDINIVVTVMLKCNLQAMYVVLAQLFRFKLAKFKD